MRLLVYFLKTPAKVNAFLTHVNARLRCGRRREMERAAQRLTMSLGYQGLGTVEYLYDPSLNEFYFLELNPRLQVEHPVTEAVTDQNLPALQLQLGMEIPLRRIPSIRRLFGKKPETQEAIDFLAEDYQVPTKHVIAVGSLRGGGASSSPSLWPSSWLFSQHEGCPRALTDIEKRTFPCRPE